MKKILTIAFFVCGVFMMAGIASAAVNNTANVFIGNAMEYCTDYLGYNQYYCQWLYGNRANDKVVLKWSDEYARGDAENWSNPPYNSAWVIEVWNGKTNDGSGVREYWKWGWDEGCATGHTPSMGGAAYCWGSSPFVILMHQTQGYYKNYLYWDWKKIDGKWYNHALPAGLGNL